LDFYFNKAKKWQDEIGHLKWGCPSYTFQKNNVVLIHTFKTYCGHISQPKQSKTRESRIEKSMEKILEGKGLDD